MNAKPLSAVRPVFAAAALVVSALGLSVVAQGFLPAEPHVGIARAHAVLERAEHIRDVRLADAPAMKTASVATIIR